MRAARISAIGALIALSACAAPDTPPPARPSEPPPRTSKPAPAPDMCGATQAQKYVGRSRLELPPPVRPDRQRVACNTCAVTLDYRPDRLNIFFDAETGVVTEVRCG